MMIKILFLILLSCPVFGQLSLEPFDPKTSTTTKSGDYITTYSSSAIKFIVEEKSLSISRDIKTYPSYTKQIDNHSFDLGLIFKVEPSTNMWEFNFEGVENFDFFYQPELNEEEIKDGSIRPENIVGSYAVYFKNNGGKVFHIYRPQMIDNKGNKIWCDMFYNDKKQRIEVVCNNDWLKTATYPLLLDPTLGYTTIGATQGTWAWDTVKMVWWKAPMNGDLRSLSVAVYSDVTTPPMAYAVYNSTGGNPETTGYAGDLIGQVTTFYLYKITPPTNPEDWVTMSINGNLIAETTYWICAISRYTTKYFYDTVLNDIFSINTNNTWIDNGTAPNPYSPITGISRFKNNLSIYLTYDRKKVGTTLRGSSISGVYLR